MQKKYKNLYANGDSFVFGMESIEDCSTVEENKNYSFPKYLSNLLDCDSYINNSYCGASNDFIFRQTVFDVVNENFVPSETFVIIGWTSLNRIDVGSQGYLDQLPEFLISKDGPLGQSAPKEHKDYGIMFVNPGWDLSFKKDDITINPGKEIVDWCTKYLWTDQLQVPLIESKMISLHYMLEYLGYDHLFVNTVSNLPFTKHIDINCKNFYDLDRDSFFQWSIKNFSKHHRRWNHFGHTAHNEYAKKLYEHISKQFK